MHIAASVNSQQVVTLQRVISSSNLLNSTDRNFTETHLVLGEMFILQYLDVGGAWSLTWYLSECTESSVGRGDETHDPPSRLMWTENTD